MTCAREPPQKWFTEIMFTKGSGDPARLQDLQAAKAPAAPVDLLDMGEKADAMQGNPP